jgi:adenylate cyclase class IV
MRSTSPRVELDAPSFFRLLRHLKGSTVNTATISQIYYDTADSFFRSQREMLRLRCVQLPDMADQWDVRLKWPVPKSSEDSFVPNSASAVLPAARIPEILENPSVLLTAPLLPQALRRKFARSSSLKLKKVGQIATNRRYLAAGELLLKADENVVEGGPPFYTVGIAANDLERAKEEVRAVFGGFGVAVSFFERTKYARLLGE